MGKNCKSGKSKKDKGKGVAEETLVMATHEEHTEQNPIRHMTRQNQDPPVLQTLDGRKDVYDEATEISNAVHQSVQGNNGSGAKNENPNLLP